jgi:selenocysteine lyase/cysteine desulfurase
VPDTVTEVAAIAMRQLHATPESVAQAIAEALAQEIEADRDEVAKGEGSKSVAHTGGRLWGLNRAARIVREAAG